MTLIAAICQVIIALGIFNVWLVRRDRPTPFRPDGAASMEEEFRAYGLPDWVRTVVGTAKVGLAVLLLVGLAVSQVAVPAAAMMGALMVAAVVAHIRVRDPLVKAVPALVMLLLSTTVVITHTAI